MSAVADLAARLTGLTLRDEHRLGRRLAAAQRERDPQRNSDALSRLAAEVERAEALVARRLAAVPEISYPDLPVSAVRADLAAAIRDHQVVVLAGETGSGKTTQLPKICLELGRGVRGLIGHTQPRRIAARTVADRIATELGRPLGTTVGWKVRFTDDVAEDTLVKLMTDGVLLAELTKDRRLLQYDTIIVDEAHERSLNIDFLLGYLHSLLPQRPDLRVVVTSATIDPQHFAKHFGNAPVIEVSGRTYPVEVRYRPLADESADAKDRTRADREPRDQVTAVCDAVDELAHEDGDVLVFLSGEREIRDTADALRARQPQLEVLPLYARLSVAEQARAFQPGPGRRVVLATNVAETSLTVPGIRHVVDVGTARISRYSSRLKVQRLPIEPISRASADQRAGRCGRVADGICIRLYSEDDYLTRPQFTDPEILRTSLASVLLQMMSLGLGAIEDFPFLDPPDRRAVRDGIGLLDELGALEPGKGTGDRRLTTVGRRLAQLPLEPRFARMVVEADRLGCVHSVLVVAAALSIQDPRERPSDAEQQATQSHARFRDPTSDLASYLLLWRYLREQQRDLSSSGFRRLCRQEFLHYLRIREWQDLVGQLRRIAEGLGMDVTPRDASPEVLHTALLAGLLSHVGLRDPVKRDYRGARGTRFLLGRSSGLAKSTPTWVVAAELVETNRLYARDAARIEPAWVEGVAGHVVLRQYSEPRWDRRRAAAVATERVTLYGLPLVTARTVGYATVDPVAARDLFVRSALVEGDWETHHRFWQDNRRRLDSLAELEDRVRQRGIGVDDDALFEFYDARVPRDVVSGRHFDAWWKVERRRTPELLDLPEALLREAAQGIGDEDFPRSWSFGDVDVPVSYLFEPGEDDDGVTVHVPLALLNQLQPTDVAGVVPGHREDLVVALLRGLPKPLRVTFVPIPDTARALLPLIEDGPLPVALSRAVRRLTGVDVAPTEWRLEAVPNHLRVTVSIQDEAGTVLAAGKDLEVLKRALRPRLQASLSRASAGIERTGLRTWDVGDIPERVVHLVGGAQVEGFPALVDEGSTVSLRVLAGRGEQLRQHAVGVRRLLLLGVPDPLKAVHARLSTADRLALSTVPGGDPLAVLKDAVAATVDELMVEHGGAPRTAEAFERLRSAVRAALPERAAESVGQVAAIAVEHGRLADQRARLAGLAPAALADIDGQLARLLGPGWVLSAGTRRLRDIARYLRAVTVRLERLPRELAKDAGLTARARAVEEDYRAALDRLPPEEREGPEARSVGWLLEEFRVSLFAQALGTAQPVSERRILRALDDLLG